MSAQELAEATAIHVMGWEIITQHEDMRRFQTSDYPDGKGIIALYGIRYVARTGGRRIDWNPAEDISAAWEVVEQLKLIVAPNNNGGWKSGVMNGARLEKQHVIWSNYWVFSDTAPEAICKAALLAVMGL